MNNNSSMDHNSHCYTKDCAEKRKDMKVHVNAVQMIYSIQKEIADTIHWADKLVEFGVKTKELIYDDLVYASDETKLATLKGLIKFIYPGENIQASLSYVKNSKSEVTTDYDHSKSIENYEEFEIALRNTPYHKYLHTGNISNLF